MKTEKIVLVIITLYMMIGSLFASGSSEITDNKKIFIERDFHSISNSIDADLEIHLGEEYRVEAYGDKADLKMLDIFVRSGKLVIKRKPGLFPIKRIRDVRIDIALPAYELKELALSSSGNAEVIGLLKSDETELKSSSSGSIIASGDVEFLEINCSSSGNIDFEGNSREITIKNSSSGDISINAQSMKLRASISSSGNIKAEGASLETELSISSGGEFLGRDFQSETADITLSSSGSAELTVVKELEASLSSSGNLIYSGNPALSKISESSSGKLIQRE